MKPMLEVKNLHVEVGGTKILHGLDLAVNKGEVHAIMGPNGGGKSTLSYVLAGKPGYDVTNGEILFDGDAMLDMPADERAAKGLFLAFQYPLEIPGVATMTFLRAALNAQRKARGEAELSSPELIKRVRDIATSSGSITRCCVVRKCGFLRRREEAQRNAADDVAGAQARGARRDRLRTRHRCPQGGGRRRQPAALAAARLRRDHPLSAPARLHRARRRPRALEGPHRAHRRQGARVRARVDGYAQYREEAA